MTQAQPTEPLVFIFSPGLMIFAIWVHPHKTTYHHDPPMTFTSGLHGQIIQCLQDHLSKYDFISKLFLHKAINMNILEWISSSTKQPYILGTRKLITMTIAIIGFQNI